jgi:two-component system sensor histidine kinase PilS (NtrC family)
VLYCTWIRRHTGFNEIQTNGPSSCLLRGEKISQVANFSDYPLPEDLTSRVVTYLNLFRLFISFALIVAFFSGILIRTYFLDNAAIAGTFLISYFVMAIYLAIEARRRTAQHFFLAQVSLFTDILFLSVLLFTFGGLNSGLAVLLMFASASAAILLPLRIALFLASLVVLALIGESMTGLLLYRGATTELLQAGLYGITTFIITILVNLLSYWLRDYRILAEKQAVELTRLEQINELVIRRMRSGVLAVDADCHIQLMNESAWFLLGTPSGQRKALTDIAPELEKAMLAWRKDPSRDNEPLTLHASQAQVVPKFVSLPGSAEIRVLIFLEDNDVVAQRALELSANSLAKLSGSIAHEIRNPLAAISHAAQLLAEVEGMPVSDSRLVNIIHNQSRRMNDIVENILQLSRREKSRPDIIDLKSWLKDIVDEFKGALPAMNIDMTTEFETKDVLVLFDRSQLHQAIWKLMENALQHAGQENQTPRVMIILERLPETGYCIVTVEDNGPGISEEQIEHIFEPFYTTHKQGSGLGLYIARQLCEVNQAELTVNSSLGEGTRFHIRLALARSDMNEANQLNEPSSE